MRIRSFRSILNECLTALQQGESVEACLSRYPRQAERLRPLLLLAQGAARTPRVAPRPSAQQTAWEVVRQRASDLRQGRRRPRGQMTWLRPAAIVASLLLALLAAGGGTVYAAQDSLPDSPLYRVKLASEDARLWFVFDDADKADILLDQSGERTDEILALIQRGKPVSGNVLSALRDRNERAADILAGMPQETALRARMLQQSEAQENLLLALWDEISESARGEYAEAVTTLHNTRLGTSGAAVAIDPEDLAGGVLNISGLADPVTDGVWLIGGVEVSVDERTFGPQLASGQTAKVVAARGANGRLHALNLSTIAPSLPDAGTVVSGAVDKVTDTEIMVAGQRIAITPQTLLHLKVQEGQRVQITVSGGAGGAVASTVEPAQTEGVTSAPALAYEGAIEGDVNAQGSTNQWIIGGQTFEITASTTVDAQAGAVKAGARARVEGVSQGGKLIAERVVILAADAQPQSIHLTGVFQGQRQGIWLVSGLAVEPNQGAETPAVGSLVAIEASRQDKRLVGQRAIVLESPGDDRPVQLLGLVGAVDGDTWTVGFARVHVGQAAKVSGDPIVGARALVWGQQGGDGTLEATYIRVLDQRSIIPGAQQ
ncbi:MAG: hypothetical protein HYY03_03825 [Chloroflexi bacterium]|nr:hypothetical protein [Chloroflexota bacterium]